MARGDSRRVDLVEAFAHGAGGAHHHRVGELAGIVVEDALGLQIGGRDGERRRQADLEFARTRRSRPSGRSA